ncbi:hypothetical protein [uncultured Methanobrevibacter sp.]|uniref:hypothetical protein n=1 Tax=uncultured Methanobrevibacter sp. TaxID=253161 RepID=UPI0025F178CB|nr:hypothetical protein [uncultured Methanobrevibacter sp.]
MADNSITRYLISLLTGYRAISIGTKFFPTNETETEYVDLFNYTETILLELEEAEITTDSIFYNLMRDVGEENIPENHSFYELKPAEQRVEEYALVSNIIMGNDRYLYIEIPHPHKIMNEFANMIVESKGQIVERSSSEIVAKMSSKNEAIKIALHMISLGYKNNLIVTGAVGMTGAAALERSINYTREVGGFSGIAFTKLGGEYALVIDGPFEIGKSRKTIYDNYLFIDIIDSTGFISKYGRDRLLELMNGVKSFVESECHGQVEGYREGGDDFIARFPSKDLAIRAGLDTAWFILNNGAKIRAGVGRSRREAGERAQIADDIFVLGKPLSLVVFELANGIYAYNVPSEFSRTIIDLFTNHKGKLIVIFAIVFVLCYFLAVLGQPIYAFAILLIVIIYAAAS